MSAVFVLTGAQTTGGVKLVAASRMNGQPGAPCPASAMVPASVKSVKDYVAWAKANPAGVIVSYFDGSPLRLPGLPYYRGVARDRWVAIWPTSAVIQTEGKALDSNF